MTEPAPSSDPVFVAIDADGAGAQARPRVLACAAAAAGVRTFAADALDDIAEALGEARAFSRDALTEQFWLDELFGAQGRAAPVISDWMLALAPFGVARNLAAIVRNATRSDEFLRDAPLDAAARAAHMRAVYELARTRAT